MPFMSSIRLDGLLSFAPGSEAIPLTPLNVMIGPNGSGKSNLIEAIELLHAAPTALASAIREGGSTREWLWKGDGTSSEATIEAELKASAPMRDLRYRLSFGTESGRFVVTDEVIEDATKRKSNTHAYYRYQAGCPVLNVSEPESSGPRARGVQRLLTGRGLVPDESILSRRKDPDLYPELTWVGQQFARIQTFRAWSFGRFGSLRQGQSTHLPNDHLLPDSSNLALLLNQLEHTGASAELNAALTRFLPRYLKFSTLIQGGSVQFFLHEEGLHGAIPATRLSDGTIRFIAMLVLLLTPNPPPLICIEEPELGLHPDAMTILSELMVEASKRTQLIVTTHSDALVSALSEEADSVLVCEYRGGTFIKRLDSAKLRHWMGEYRLGDLWRIGELGGNP